MNAKGITHSNTLILIMTAEKMGLKVEILDPTDYTLRLSNGSKSHTLNKNSFRLDPLDKKVVAINKHKTYLKLKENDLPHLPQEKVRNVADYIKIANGIGFPQVIKPLTGEKGKLVFLNISNERSGEKALEMVLADHKVAVVEEYFPSATDYRFLVLDGSVIGVAKRLPPQVVGNGKDTLVQLIDSENKKRVSMINKYGIRDMWQMTKWDQISEYLGSVDKALSDVPQKGEVVEVMGVPNFALGGTTETVSIGKIHTTLIELAQKVAKALDLTVCGVDMLIIDHNKTASDKNCRVVEVNSEPSPRLHEWPTKGKSQHVVKKILDFIFE